MTVEQAVAQLSSRINESKTKHICMKGSDNIYERNDILMISKAILRNKHKILEVEDARCDSMEEGFE